MTPKLSLSVQQSQQLIDAARILVRCAAEVRSGSDRSVLDACHQMGAPRRLGRRRRHRLQHLGGRIDGVSVAADP